MKAAGVVAPIKQEVDNYIYSQFAREQLEKTGELLPGIERTEARESFSIKFPGPKGGSPGPKGGSPGPKGGSPGPKGGSPGPKGGSPGPKGGSEE
jgi:hypothetical protein